MWRCLRSTRRSDPTSWLRSCFRKHFPMQLGEVSGFANMYRYGKKTPAFTSWSSRGPPYVVVMSLSLCLSISILSESDLCGFQKIEVIIATHIFLGKFHPQNLGKIIFYNLTAGIFVQPGWGKNPPTGEKVHPFRLEGSPPCWFQDLGHLEEYWQRGAVASFRGSWPLPILEATHIFLK